MIFLQQLTFSSFVLKKIDEGGPFIMVPLLIIFVICMLIAIRSFWLIRKEAEGSEKNIRLLNSLGLFALVYGVFGQLLGLVEVLDQFSGDIETSANQLAMGLKFTILSTLLGCFIFLVAKAVTILLTTLQAKV